MSSMVALMKAAADSVIKTCQERHVRFPKVNEMNLTTNAIYTIATFYL